MLSFSFFFHSVKGTYLFSQFLPLIRLFSQETYIYYQLQHYPWFKHPRKGGGMIVDYIRSGKALEWAIENLGIPLIGFYSNHASTLAEYFLRDCLKRDAKREDLKRTQDLISVCLMRTDGLIFKDGTHGLNFNWLNALHLDDTVTLLATILKTCRERGSLVNLFSRKFEGNVSFEYITRGEYFARVRKALSDEKTSDLDEEDYKEVVNQLRRLDEMEKLLISHHPDGGC